MCFCAMATLHPAGTQPLKAYSTLLICSEGSRRFDNQVSLVTGQLMSEVYDAGVLADVQQAQRSGQLPDSYYLQGPTGQCELCLHNCL